MAVAEGERLARGQAEDGQTPWSAADHFLDGERHRAAATAEPTRTPDGRQPARSTAEAALRLACDAYQRALGLEPDYYWARFQLGRCYLALGRRDEAVDVNEDGVDLGDMVRTK